MSGQLKGTRARYTTLEAIVMTLKLRSAAGHVAASALYMSFIERHGTSQAPDQTTGYIVIPERLSTEEWKARYMPKDDPPVDSNDID